jgi:hypothetical protein
LGLQFGNESARMRRLGFDDLVEIVRNGSAKQKPAVAAGCLAR